MTSSGRVVKEKAKKELDPEEIMHRKFLAKCRFRALGRMVMANTYWMIEAAEQYEGVEDVKRRVAQAVRGKAKKKRLLTITDKALLNKPNSERTDQEKKYIFRIIGGLKCFKRYPNHVKKKLAAVTYFKYYRPNSVIVRQHHEAHALYFIVTGDVTVSQMIFDELLQQYLSVDIGVMHSGDMFGEVSLLHNIPRTATCTTVGHCELLALMKEDFKNVLQASVQKQWDEVRRAMSAFTYFDALDEVAQREGCIVAKMKSYQTNDTILGDGCGIANYVYFILSGQCQMIETLQVCVKQHCGHTTYSLYDPYVPKEESEQDLDTKYFGAYKDKAKELEQSSLENAEISASRSGSKRLESILRYSESKRKSTSSTKRESIQLASEATASEAIASAASAGTAASVPGTITEASEGEVAAASESVEPVKSKVLLPPTEQRESVRYSVSQPPLIRPEFRTYFMQVVRYNPGSTFGFGENMRDRRIVALTPVDCMLMPKMWLLQRNTANIWSRIQHFLEKKITPSKCLLWSLSIKLDPHISNTPLGDLRVNNEGPTDVYTLGNVHLGNTYIPSCGSTIDGQAIPTKKQLFQDYVAARRWQDFRDQLVGDVVARSNTVNWTSLHDVPYSIRMEEMTDI